jgi:hypothetical protein
MQVKLAIAPSQTKPMAEFTPILALLGNHSAAFDQAIELSIGLLAIMAVLGWIWLRDELKDKP